jgi:threonyl-tRNA synthetase
LELFAFSEKVGMGLPLWLPKGTALRERLVNFLTKAQAKAGYEQVVTPHIGHKKLICNFWSLGEIRQRFFPAD